MSISKLEPDWNVEKLIAKFPTDEAIAAESKRAKKKAFFLLKLSGVSFVTALSVIIVTTTVHRIWPAMLQNGSMGDAITGGIALLGMVTMMVSVFAGSILHEKAELLSPLGSSEYCVEANDLVNRYVAARKIRDAALESGRQLYVLDYVKTALAARRSRPDNEEELRQAACASIHKLHA